MRSIELWRRSFELLKSSPVVAHNDAVKKLWNDMEIKSYWYIFLVYSSIKVLESSDEDFIAFLGFNRNDGSFSIVVNLEEIDRIIDLERAVKESFILKDLDMDIEKKKELFSFLLLDYILSHEVLHYINLHWVFNPRYKLHPLLSNIVQDSLINLVLFPKLVFLYPTVIPVDYKEFLDPEFMKENKKKDGILIPIYNDFYGGRISKFIYPEVLKYKDSPQEFLNDVRKFIGRMNKRFYRVPSWEKLFDKLFPLHKFVNLNLLFPFVFGKEGGKWILGYEVISEYVDKAKGKLFDMIEKFGTDFIEHIKGRGFGEGDIQEEIEVYKRSKIKQKWIKHIKDKMREISNLDIDLTKKRPSKRLGFPPSFKLTHKEGNKLLVLLDSSGSMESLYISELLSEIYYLATAWNIDVSCYIYDVVIHKKVNINEVLSGKVVIEGRGGTSVNEAVKMALKKDKEFEKDFRNSKVVVIMTDGYDDIPDFEVFKGKKILAVGRGLSELWDENTKESLGYDLVFLDLYEMESV